MKAFWFELRTRMQEGDLLICLPPFEETCSCQKLHVTSVVESCLQKHGVKMLMPSFAANCPKYFTPALPLSSMRKALPRLPSLPDGKLRPRGVQARAPGCARAGRTGRHRLREPIGPAPSLDPSGPRSQTAGVFIANRPHRSPFESILITQQLLPF